MHHPDTVDLAAVATARAELRSLVERHPTLTLPAAQERLARWLTREVSPVPKAPPPPEDSESVQLGVRIPRALLAVLDTEVERLRATVPRTLRDRITRSDAVRELIARAAPPAEGAASPPAPTATPSTKGATLTTESTDVDPSEVPLMERYRRAHKAGFSHVKVAAATGTSEATLRRWFGGARALAPDLKRRVQKYLAANGY